MRFIERFYKVIPVTFATLEDLSPTLQALGIQGLDLTPEEFNFLHNIDPQEWLKENHQHLINSLVLKSYFVLKGKRICYTQKVTDFIEYYQANRNIAYTFTLPKVNTMYTVTPLGLTYVLTNIRDANINFLT